MRSMWRRWDTGGKFRVLGLILVRAEVDLNKNLISFYRLRRREPMKHELMATAKYKLPKRVFKE
jgi:hypothetical protein